LKRHVAARHDQPARQPEIWKADHVVRVQVGQEHALNVLPPYTELDQTLQRASSGIEDELLFPSFDQGARPEAVHDGRRTTRAQQSHFELLSLRGRRGNDRNEQRQSRRAAKVDH